MELLHDISRANRNFSPLSLALARARVRWWSVIDRRREYAGDGAEKEEKNGTATASIEGDDNNNNINNNISR